MTHQEFTLIANLISKSANVKCIQNENKRDINWKADPVKKIIYYPQNTLYIDSDLGYLIHEIGHIRFSQPVSLIELGDKKFIKWVKKFGKLAEQIFSLINALEDIRIEQKMKRIYKGASKYLGASYNEALNTDFHHHYNMSMYNPIGFKDYCNSSWLHYCKYYLWKYSSGNRTAKKYLKRWNVKKDTREAIQKTDSNIIKKIIKCETTQELCNFIKDNLLTIYLPLCDDAKKQIPMKSKKDFEKLMKEIIKEFIEIITLIEKRIKKAKKEGKSIIKKIDEKIKIDGNITERIELEKQGESTKRNLNKIITEIFNTKAFTYYDKLTIKEINEAIKLSLPSTKKAISILKDIEIERYEGNYESGKLQNRKLYKLKTGQTKIFTRKVGMQKDSKDMVFALLVDESGSMRSGFYSSTREGKTIRIQEAALSAAILAVTLQKCNKPFAIYGFNAEFYTHKEFNKKLKLEEIQQMISNAYGLGRGYNNDGYAINKTVKYLQKRPEKNKILIVISDGLPAPDPRNTEMATYNLSNEVLKAEKTAKVYGIGIQTDSIEEYYKRYIILEDVSQLGKKLMKIFKENVGKRTR